MSSTITKKEIPFAWPNWLITTSPNFTYDGETDTLTVSHLSCADQVFEWESTTNFETTWNTIIWSDGTNTLTVNAKLTGQLYCNDTGKSAQTLKIHSHASTSWILGAEFKTDSASTSGLIWGTYNEATLNATWTESLMANSWIAIVKTGATVTWWDVIWTYSQARVDGSTAGDSVVTASYNLIEASSALTAGHVTSLWLDTHQDNVITGSYQLLYWTENGATALDQVMYFRTPWASALMELDTCNAMVSNTATTAGASKKIAITIDGVVYYLNAYAGD